MIEKHISKIEKTLNEASIYEGLDSDEIEIIEKELKNIKDLFTLHIVNCQREQLKEFDSYNFEDWILKNGYEIDDLGNLFYKDQTIFSESQLIAKFNEEVMNL